MENMKTLKITTLDMIWIWNTKYAYVSKFIQLVRTQTNKLQNLRCGRWLLATIYEYARYDTAKIYLGCIVETHH